MMRVLASAVLLLLTGHAEAWGSSPKKAATRESPAAAAEVCANPTAAADDRLTRQVQQLAEMVGAQAARIAQLERALAAKPTKPTKPTPARKGTTAAVAPAASLADLQPELQPFRLAEAQRALRRQQAQLVRVFRATVGAPITAVALSTALLEKSVPHLPRLAAAADSLGVLHLFDSHGEEVVRVPSGHPAGAQIRAVLFGPKEDPFVATAATDGLVRVRVRVGVKTIAGRPGPRARP